MRAIALLLLLALASCVIAQDRASLLVKREILNEEVIAGRDTNVSFVIFNVGSGYDFRCRQKPKKKNKTQNFDLDSLILFIPLVYY